MRKIRAVLHSKRIMRSQLGFTLAEMVIAIIIGALVIIAGIEILHYMIITTVEHRHQTLAVLQSQYVGFWIGEDTLQAQSIYLGDSNGFPLTLRWTEWDGDENWVTYTVEPTSEGEVSKLMREQEVNGVSDGKLMVAESLDPSETRCERGSQGNNTLDILKIEVTANVDGKEATRIYEIQPRSLPVYWGRL